MYTILAVFFFSSMSKWNLWLITTLFALIMYTNLQVKKKTRKKGEEKNKQNEWMQIE